MYCKALFSIGMTCLSFLSLSVSTSAQNNIEKDKVSLQRFQKALRDEDSWQRREIEARDKQELTKGEFETTVEFEKRNRAKSDEDWSRQRALWTQQGESRHRTYSEMNKILRSEYPKKVPLDIGTYDADNQVFPIFFNEELLKMISVARTAAPKFKELFRNALADAKVGLRLNESDTAVEYLIAAEISVGGNLFRFERSSLDFGEAMVVMFGNYDKLNRRSAWKLEVGNEDDDYETYVLRTVFARQLGIINYTQKGVSKRVILAKTGQAEEGWSCHVCAMNVSIGVFAKRGSYWKLEQLRKNAIWEGSWGDVAPPTLVKIGSERFALRFDSFDMGQGYEVGTADFLEINELTLDEILYVRIHEDNTGAEIDPSRRLVKNIKITFRAGSNSEYSDAVFNISGKAPKRVGRRYVLAPFARLEIHPYLSGRYYFDGSP